jgi:hypothetical protein
MLTLFKVLYFVESAAYIRAKLLAKSSTRPTRQICILILDCFYSQKFEREREEEVGRR